MRAEETAVRPEAMVASPAAVQLTGTNRQQQILVTALMPHGQQADVTRRAELRVADPTVARVDGSVVTGLVNGQTELIVQLDVIQIRVPLRVEDAGTFPPVHFGNDIVPLFSKLRCNSSGCHGKQSGQNGFKLSVFGFDPGADFGIG